MKQWSESAPGRFIAARPFRLDSKAPSVEELRRSFQAGEFAVLAEVLNQYAGVAPDDPRMEPYWALAEELDIPIGIHLGQGPPGATHLGMTDYRAAAGRPLLLEDVLVKHPRLRLYVMHFGAPLVDEMIALMTAHPQVYVDLGGNQWMFPRAHFYRQLQRFVEAGFVKRVMFGSDQMNWPGMIEHAIDIVEEAPFLTDEQRRDILYNNGARFLRLSEEEIARHARG